MNGIIDMFWQTQNKQQGPVKYIWIVVEVFQDLDCNQVSDSA